MITLSHLNYLSAFVQTFLLSANINLHREDHVKLVSELFMPGRDQIRSKREHVKLRLELFCPRRENYLPPENHGLHLPSNTPEQNGKMEIQFSVFLRG